METSELEQAAGQTGSGLKDSAVAVVFDTSSGISMEEQEEILAGINAMTGGSRLVTEAAVTKAKKRDFLFPLLINIGAVLFLGLGSLMLSFFYGQDEQNIRESSAVIGVTERKLIQEIRRETSRLVNEKESQISDIRSKLLEADAEYRVLQESVENLTEAQMERAAYLLMMQEDYRLSLSALEDEKARILEDSRQQETVLRNQAEERVRELSAQIEQGQASLSSAMEELMRLSSEQDRAARVESQMCGYYETENILLNEGRLDEASATLDAMKEFLNATSMHGIRILETRRQTHMAAISALERAVDEARRLKEEAASFSAGRGPSQNAAQEEILARDETIAMLEARNASLQRDIAAYSSQDTEQSRIISEYVSSINALETANLNQQQTLNRRDNEILTLRTEAAQNTQQISDLTREAGSLRTQVQTANNRISETETALAQQQRENTNLSAQNQDLQRRYDDLQGRLDNAMEAAVRALQGN